MGINTDSTAAYRPSLATPKQSTPQRSHGSPRADRPLCKQPTHRPKPDGKRPEQHPHLPPADAATPRWQPHAAVDASTTAAGQLHHPDGPQPPQPPWQRSPDPHDAPLLQRRSAQGPLLPSRRAFAGAADGRDCTQRPRERLEQRVQGDHGLGRAGVLSDGGCQLQHLWSSVGSVSGHGQPSRPRPQQPGIQLSLPAACYDVGERRWVLRELALLRRLRSQHANLGLRSAFPVWHQPLGGPDSAPPPCHGPRRHLNGTTPYPLGQTRKQPAYKHPPGPDIHVPQQRHASAAQHGWQRSDGSASG